MNNPVNLTNLALQRAGILESFYDGTKGDCRMLIRFMEINQWFGFPHEVKGTVAMVDDLPIPFPPLDLWLKGMYRTDEVKYGLLVSSRTGSPDEALVTQWEAFRICENLAFTPALDGLDFMLSRTGNVWNQEQYEQFLSDAIELLPLESSRALLRFIPGHTDLFGYMPDDRYTYKPIWSRISHDTPALPFYNFSRLAVMVFDEEAVQKGCYIQKAAHSRKEAELWFFVGMHFVSALRIPDIQSLPVPHTQITGRELRERVVSGDFSISEAVALVNDWTARIELEARTPSKTRSTPGVTPVLVNIPSSVFPVFGKMLAMVVSYHEEGQPLMLSEYVTGDMLNRFFGPEFNRLCGGEYFLSTRRLNKSYLQGAEYLADHGGKSPVQGYILASLLRSHKMRHGKLSETTDIYLNDSDFMGLSPCAVAEEMFQRGIFGFIPACLLSHYDAAWHCLTLHDQTTVVQELSLTPVQIEHVTAALEEARNRVTDVLAQTLPCGTGVWSPEGREKAGNILIQVISGTVPGKHPGNMCLRSAAGLPCTDPARSGCLGCGYELWTYTGIHLLMEAYESNIRCMKDAGNIERIRLNRINQEHILPAVQGILYSVQAIAGGDEVAQALIEMIYRRMEHAKS
ncbi:MAG: hypothetical protein IJS84_01375 [Spirochaetales bacterium]|nr:hypothetical protein [Spirochaetales bacterium]